ncbi:hypothetical protein FS837_003349 [Tulasnella sp. UAMH 9824]|nr:hypothetical protein FS837_003349 [Tulasnella sp. UAMH 9824]
MSDDVQNLATFVAIALPPITIAVGYAALPRHLPPQMVPQAGQRNAPVTAIPPARANLQQEHPQQAHPPQANHHVHQEDPIVALPPPSPPPNNLQHPQDPRRDGVVPNYSNLGSSRRRTVDVVPPPNRNPPQGNVDFDEGEEVGHV